MEENDAPLITKAPVKLKGTGGRDNRKSDNSIIQFQALESSFKEQQSGLWVSFWLHKPL